MRYFLFAVFLSFSFANQASAYCVGLSYNSLNRFAVGGTKNNATIPVYIVTSGADSVMLDAAKVNTLGLGLSKNAIIAQIKFAARSFSESGPKVKLAYAGERSTSSAAIEGIVIRSRDNYSSPTSEAPWLVSNGVYGSRINIKPRNLITSPPLYWSTSPPGDALPNGTISLKAALMHEMAHSFSLNHLSDPCASGNLTNDPQHCSTMGCQSEHKSVLAGFREMPTADDIMGMSLRFGSNYRTINAFSSATGYASDWADDVVFNSTLRTKMPPAGSGFVGTAGGSALAFSDNANLLMVAYDSGTGYGAAERVGGFVVNPVYQKAAVAVGDGKLVVVWIDETDLEDFTPPLQVAYRNLNGTTWTTVAINNVDIEHFDIGLAYDSNASQFIFSYQYEFDGSSLAGILDLATGDVNGSDYLHGSILTPLPSRNLSKAACKPKPFWFGNSSSDCLIASSQRTDGTHQFSRGHATATSYVEDSTASWGTNTAFGDYDHIFWTAVVGTHTDNGLYSWIYRKSSLLGPATDQQYVYTNYWPAALTGYAEFFCSSWFCTTAGEYRLVLTP